MRVLLTNVIDRLGREVTAENMTARYSSCLRHYHLETYRFFIFRQRKEHAVFQTLVRMSPGLEETLLGEEAGEESMFAVADLVRHGLLFDI